MCPGEEVVEFKVKKSSASRRLMKLKDRKPRSDQPAVLSIGLVYMCAALVHCPFGPEWNLLFWFKQCCGAEAFD